jgi:hypothetical protein
MIRQKPQTTQFPIILLRLTNRSLPGKAGTDAGLKAGIFFKIPENFSRIYRTFLFSPIH